MNHIELQKTIRYILDNIDESRRLKDSVESIKDELIDLTLGQVISEQEFYKISSVLLSQSRSPLWEKYFIKKHNCERVNKNEDRGDFKKNGRYYEYKSSGYNQDNSIHILQIRSWQDCNYIIQSISDDRAITFVLTHAEMMLEMERIKASSAHGTQKALEENKNKELRMSIKRDSEHWNRWINNYHKEGDIFQS
ncbi:hypothetical protein C6496_16250 [Candidatus Poribacteria bacterium]|nr:MAG: hypothetical protein C6496_16250 [Candidatus Poribacteria bacterium]